jgi:hypothetical protein
MRRWAIGVGVAAAFLLGAGPLTAPAGAQSSAAAPASDRMTEAQRDYMAALDRDLAAQNYTALAEAVLKPRPSDDLKPALAWARTGTLQGRSIIVPLIYSSLLWNLGASFPQFAQFKTSSGIIALYALLVAHADGPKCSDPTAPSHRIDVIKRDYHKQFEAIASLPAATQHDALAAALRIERETAPLRQDDKYLCRFGMQETLATLQRHSKEKVAVKKPESAFAGFEIEIPADASYEPSFLPREEWVAKQAALRATFPQLLASLVAGLDAKPATPTPAP